MTDDELEPGPDTDELPSPLGSSAPPLQARIPGPPSMPTFDREAATLPPGPEDTGEWNDPLTEDPMLHAPPWGRHVNGRIDDVYGLIRELPGLLRLEVDQRISAMLETIERQFSVLIARDNTRERDAAQQAERIGALEKIDADERLKRLERAVFGDGK